jgi:LmbE family N-acetylglucosaminyl deacetylase
MNVLIVAAHPDDELLGVGGTALKHSRRGDFVHTAVLCEGVSIRYGLERVAEVVKEANSAARILELAPPILGSLPEQHLEMLPLIDVVREVEALVEEYRPEVVYTHFGGDMNRDHRIVSEAVLVATRPCSAPSVREILMFETPSSTEWGSPQLLPYFQPTTFVDISPYLEAKVEAFQCYSREVRESPHPRSPEALRARAKYWGSVICREAAEAFVVARAIR